MTHVWLAADLCPPAAVDTGGLTQPWATVIAAAIAVTGALVAFCGVWRTTNTTRKENRRAEKVAVLTEATVALQELVRAVDRIDQTEDPTARTELVAKMNAGPMKKLGDKYSVAETKLELYGFKEATTAANDFADSLAEAWFSMRDNPTGEVDLTKPHNDYDKALEAYKKAMRELP
ncbi:hypothetical protein [Mycobacterium sp. DL440]|uniref:hypothetical protein n=1 Tax=Mycobacterium sp. DL440 TaxID=2675523 RepID=UPI0014217CC9|nr:hypothetical protein [Mycobacterium sp. DL440]